MLDPKRLFAYYFRQDVREAIVEHAKDKEVVGSINNEAFRKRPDILQYPADILELVKQGVTSFHASEERWNNPLLLKPNMPRKEIDSNRIGWDFVLDIDCPDLELSRITAHFLIQAIRYYNINSVNIKFSGNHGFHIGIPFEAFPDKMGNHEMRLLFPDTPRTIAAYLKEFIASHLKKGMLNKYTVTEIAARNNKKEEDLLKKGEFDPYSIVSIDTVLLSSRHLYRMPYSFNEKSGLISIPLELDEIMVFKKEDATPEKITKIKKFLAREIVPFEAKQLVQEAYDYKTPKEEIYVIGKKVSPIETQGAIPETVFPPCINNILKGLPDGKKRSLFILLNFLSCCNWPNDKIEETIKEWNKKNPEQLKDTFLLGQLKYFKQKKEKIPPPNCNNIQQNHHDIGICIPDLFCPKIKNPINYAKRKAKYLIKEKEQPTIRTKLTEQQKDMRRHYRESKKTTAPTAEANKLG